MTGKVEVLQLDGSAARSTELPSVFNTPLRPDIIRKAVVASQSQRYQPQGRDPKAGKRTTAESMGVGHDLSRVPRVKGSQYSRAGAAAFAPSTTKGRLTHPPRAEKRIIKKLNKQEKRYAIRSAIAATGMKDVVQQRGHSIEAKTLPIVVVDEIENIRTATEARAAMTGIGVWADVKRVKSKHKVYGGRRHTRGRGKKHAVGPLIVVSQDNGIGRAVRSFEGVQVVNVNRLSAELLAPGTHPGRLTVWSESALKSLQETKGN